jgi:cardiolipin synthase (CMP-forming)
MNAANLITLGRIAVLPFIALFYYTEMRWFAFILFVLAALSDYLDGWVARHYNQQTRLGAMLDQISDKLVVLTMLLLLASTGWLEAPGVLAAILITVREIWVSGMREFVSGQGSTIVVSGLSKYKTTVQMAAIAVLLLAGVLPEDAYPDPMLVFHIGEVLLLLAAALTVWTGAQYTWHNRRFFADQR